MKNEFIVIDFETTGLSPDYCRIIEVGAVRVKDNQIIDNFQALMNPGIHIPYFITDYTGITNDMVKNKPCPEKIMPALKNFIGDSPLIAHNASFDRKFLYAEMDRVNCKLENTFLCTLLLSRRLIPDCFNYQLGTLVEHLSIDRGSLRLHRALDDVIMTAHVWFHIYELIRNKTGFNRIDVSKLKKMMKIPKNRIGEYLEKISREN